MTNDQNVKPKIKIEQQEKHANIYAALSAFQGELKPMAKTGKVQFETKAGKKVDFAYTPLGDIMATIYPLLKKHGLAVRHEVTDRGVEAILTHETYKRTPSHETVHDIVIAGAESMASGKQVQIKIVDYVENEIRSGIVKISYGAEMKDVGAAITYARRYTLTMMLGISSEDDNDAELLDQSAKNAIQTVYIRFKMGIEKATTVAEAEKQMSVLKKDLKTLEDGKAPALGLSEDQYKELMKLGEAKVEDLKTVQE